MIIGLGFLFFTAFAGTGATPERLANASQTLEIWRQLALWGVLGASLGASWLMWGEETLGPILLIVGFGLFFSTWYLPMAINSPNKLQEVGISGISAAGIPAIIIGFVMVVLDVVSRVRFSAAQGARAEHLKYGKNVNEERDVRNVLLGKCWQLPYCRKFVRERCPIYHSRRTCWKERVGCMCEEAVIKNAMEGGTIPKDIVAAAKFIPRNTKLTPNQKAERCRHCVIYNEHQKHKYKVILPVATIAIALLYLAFRAPLAGSIKGALATMQTTVHETTDVTGTGTVITNDVGDKTTISSDTSATDLGGVIPYHEIILVVFTLVLLAYMIKIVEFLLFKLKV